MNHTPLKTDTSKAGRVFDKLGSIFGVQKMGSMWPPSDIKEVKADWNVQLDRFSWRTLSLALQSVVDSGREWPPSLSEFVRICRDYNRPESQGPEKALPSPGQGHTDAEAAKAQLAKIREMMRGAVKTV